MPHFLESSMPARLREKSSESEKKQLQEAQTSCLMADSGHIHSRGPLPPVTLEKDL